MKLEKALPRAASVMAVTSRTSCWASRKRGTGAHSLVSLLIMIAVPTPQLGWQPQESAPHCESGKGGDEGDGEPIAGRLHFADLAADVLRKMRKGVALAQAALRGDIFVAAGEGNRLEADEGDLLGIFHREFHDCADLIVVDVVYDGDYQHDLVCRLLLEKKKEKIHV